jgi:hypothetical protein
MAMANKLMKMTYIDNKAEVRLEAYADTVVLEKEGNTTYLVAIRFGGYPESVKGMSEAIYGGGSVEILMGEHPLTVSSRVKRYRKELSHDGLYAEATLLIQDEEQRAGQDENSNGKNQPRTCYLFSERDKPARLFEELDKKTAVPLIPAFQEYVLAELQKRGILRPLQVVSHREKFDAWVLRLSEDEKNIIAVVQDGLKSGAIAIPGAKEMPFPEVHSVSQYLNTFGVMIAQRIQSQFQPLFDPAT